jgi:hypothetical protein
LPVRSQILPSVFRTANVSRSTAEDIRGNYTRKRQMSKMVASSSCLGPPWSRSLRRFSATPCASKGMRPCFCFRLAQGTWPSLCLERR